MTVELLKYLSLGSFILAGVFLLVSVALFFLLDVPKLYGDISGRTAKKAIAAIREQNENSGNKAYKSSAVNLKRGKLTDKITHSGRVIKSTDGLPIHVGTEELPERAQSAETTVLYEPANETTVLNNETTVLNQESYPVNYDNDTVEPVSYTEQRTVSYDGDFSKDVEMSFTGSSEIIE